MTATWRYSLMSIFCAALAGAAMADTVEEGVSRPGATFQTLPLDPQEDAPACAALCAAEEICRAWTFIRPGHPEKGADRFGLCLLKDAVPEPVAEGCCVSGVTRDAEAVEEAPTADAPEGRPAADARGWIGLRVQNVTPEIATAMGLSRSEGALVVSAVPGGPADLAGLREGDLIVAVGGTAIADSRALVGEVAARAPGDKAVVTVLRGFAELALEVEFGARRD